MSGQILVLQNAAGVTISGNDISGSGRNGIHLSGASTTPLIKNNRIFSNNVGILCDSSANPTIGGSPANANDINDNTTYSVQNTTTDITINATYNWWGSLSGPSLSGLNAVSSYVDYTNYLGGAVISQPVVSSTTPADGATYIVPNSAITITWNKYIDCSTVNTTNITINGASFGSPTCAEPTTTATFPVSGQDYNNVYTATIGTGVKDIYGNNMASAAVISFSTIPIYTLTVTKQGIGGVTSDMGDLSWNGDLTIGTASYHGGTSGNLTATAGARYTFHAWYLGGIYVSNQMTWPVTMYSDKDIIAAFYYFTGEPCVNPPESSTGLTWSRIVCS